MSFYIVDTVLASAVADNGTVTLSYPSGTTQATFTGVNAAADGVVVRNHNEVYQEADPGMSLTYGSSDITLTNLSGVAWAVGDVLKVQLGAAGNDRPGFQKGTAITSLTDNSGGTASDTLAAITGSYVEATMENTVASLAKKINQILIALRSNGMIS